MPYSASTLVPLVAAGGFTLWHYRTADTRAAVLAAGYFSTAANQLLPGHLVILQANDAMAFLPVRSGAAVGNGLVVDATSAPISLTAGGSLDIEADLAASAVARCLSLGPVPSGLTVGDSFTVQANVTGPVSTVRFAILNAASAEVVGPTTATVSAGTASATFAAPSPGTGYRLRAVDAAEPLVAQISPSFVVTAAFALLIESGLGLLVENGSRIIL
ncbi:hypothetical protein [Muricoccus radiodurans]|uniref:hypothetical protein n=1 Tax=Muricoccus radiodurans TaxID=2231721 RepID=UPI003CECEBAC